MFTGIVSAVGRVTAVRRDTGNGAHGGGVVLTIAAPYRGLKRGESIAVDGACLTVERVVKGGFTVRAVATTLDRTLFGEYGRGRRVNLERAVRASDRLGGHIVQGHVDGIGVVRRTGRSGDALTVDLEVPAEVRALSVPLGSITVDGVSLTVNALPGEQEAGRGGKGGRPVVQVALVPHTLRHTTLGERQPGARVHVEGDVLAKYVKALCHSEP